MRRIAFAVAILGMFFLFLFFNTKPTFVGTIAELNILSENKKVFVEGKVVSERNIYEGTLLLVLENGIEVICECSGNFLDSDIEVEGFAEEYEGKKQVRALEIGASR